MELYSALLNLELYAWFLLPAIFLLGIITSYTDIKYGKIKNKWILIFLLYGIIVYGVFFLYTLSTDASATLEVNVGEEKIEYPLLIQIISNFFLSLVLGFIVWLFNIWSAADAKLFVTFSFLTPLAFYTEDLIRYFPGIVIAINAIVLIIIFLVIQVLRKNFSDFKNSLKETFKSPNELLNDVMMLFLIHWLMSFIFTYLNREELTIFFVLIILLLVRYFIHQLGDILKKFKFILIIAVITRVLLEYEYIFSLDFLFIFSILVFVFVILKNLFFNIADMAFNKRVHINKLKPGMVWDKYLIDTGKEITPRKHYKKNKWEKALIEPSVEGLTKNDVRKIKNAYKKNKITVDSIDISSKTYFAPFLFAATIMTMALGGSLLTYIFPFLN